MSINILGINHKSAPLDIREKLVFNKDAIPHALNDLKKIDGINEVVLLSTCNRTEIYTESNVGHSNIIEWLINNLYIVNPYSEINRPVAIKYNQTDFNWIEDNSQNYLDDFSSSTNLKTAYTVIKSYFVFFFI